MKWKFPKLFILMLATLFWGNIHVKAQTKTQKSIITSVPVALGGLVSSGMSVSKSSFLQNAPSGLIITNGSGVGTIIGFNVTVFTHNLYEDSVGNPIIMQDIYTQFIDGPKFADNVQQYFSEKLQLGDTILIDNIKVQMDGGAILPGTSLQYAIISKD